MHAFVVAFITGVGWTVGAQRSADPYGGWGEILTSQCPSIFTKQCHQKWDFSEFVPGDSSDGGLAWSCAGDRRPCARHLCAGRDVGVGRRGKAGERGERRVVKEV